LDIEKAKKNREKFLAEHKEKFNKSINESEKELRKGLRNEHERELAKIREKKHKMDRAKIISDLIAREPSYLNERWIIKEVVNWMRDRDCFDCLEEVFIKAPKMYALTIKKRTNIVRDFYVTRRIDQIMAEKGVGLIDACEIFVGQIRDFVTNLDKNKEDFMVDYNGNIYLGWDLTTNDLDLQNAIKRVYQIAKKNKSKRFLPWPYYGKDVEIDENGNLTIFGGR
jgi:hypothetical protein